MLSPVPANEPQALTGRRVLILVQGELAQSPRMLNHGRAVCEAGGEAVLVGYDLLPLPDDIVKAPRITVRRISEAGTSRLDSVPRLFYLPVPALPLLLRAARLRGAEVIVDWHGRTAAMLALRLGKRHPAVGVVNRLEGWLARQASDHFAVSEAMRDDLQERFGIMAAVLRDRPRVRQAALNAEQRIAVVRRVLNARRAAAAPEDALVLVSPTSFGADEDMDMLLDAFTLLSRGSPARPILLFATGYGPLRSRFEARANKIANDNFRIVTGWLSEPLYRDLLRAADLGVSMHRSASGVDLPMKVVDMVEAGLPAAVFDYGPALSELVPPELKSLMFTDAQGLADRLAMLMLGPKLADLHTLMAQESGPLWREEWRRVALPAIAGA